MGDLASGPGRRRERFARGAAGAAAEGEGG